MPCRDYGPMPGEPGYGGESSVDTTEQRKWMLKSFIQETGNKPIRSGLNSLSAQLCSILKYLPKSTLSTYSPELQKWWENHLIADKEAEEKRKQNEEKRVALSKLTLRERKLLNLPLK